MNFTLNGILLLKIQGKVFSVVYWDSKNCLILQLNIAIVTFVELDNSSQSHNFVTSVEKNCRRQINN